MASHCDRLSLTLFLVAAMTPLSAASAPASHNDTKCTKRGTTGPDKLIGTAKRDVICGLVERTRSTAVEGTTS